MFNFLSDSEDDEVKRQIAKEKRTFSYTDKDKDGFLTKDELPRLLQPDMFLDMQDMLTKSRFVGE